MNSRILQFIENEARNYIVPDIRRLASIRPEGPMGLGSCAIAQAMFLFVIMEFFGYLIRDDVPNPNQKDTKGNLSQLFLNSLAGFPPEYVAHSCELVHLFRHGLMHQIFPKASGIRKAGATRPLFASFDNLNHLNVDRLAEDVLKMIECLRSGLPGSPALCEQMSLRMDKVSEKDFKKRNNIAQ